MSGKPALIREREAKKVIQVAKQAGAKEVEFRYGEVTAIVRLGKSEKPAASQSNEWLAGDAHQA